MTGSTPHKGRPDNTPARTTWLATRSASQEFCTPSGIWWRVYEVGERRSGPVVEPRSLVFESMSVMRRVCGFPSNWASLDGVALERLSRER